MSGPIIEVTKLQPDGVRVVFRTSRAYVSGSLSVFVSGATVAPLSAGGFVESGVAEFTMTAAPRIGDTIQVHYTVR